MAICDWFREKKKKNFYSIFPCFSGPELMRYFHREDAVPPSGGGMKDFSPEGSWLEAKRLEAAQKDVRDTLKEERVSSQ